MTRSVLAAFAEGGTEYTVEPDATAASYFEGEVLIKGVLEGAEVMER